MFPIIAFSFTRRLIALSCPLLSDMEALSRVDQVAVSLPAPGPVVDGFLKMIAGQLVTSDEGHTLKEVHTQYTSF